MARRHEPERLGQGLGQKGWARGPWLGAWARGPGPEVLGQAQRTLITYLQLLDAKIDANFFLAFYARKNIKTWKKTFFSEGAGQTGYDANDASGRIGRIRTH